MPTEQKIRQRTVEKLLTEIQNLNASELEYIGHALIELVENKDLVHRGLSISGAPAGYTVDTFSADRLIVCEYSVEQNYFTENLTKLKKDVAHVKAEAPSCKKLYLLSSQICPGPIRELLPKAIKCKFPDLEAYEVYDGRSIAEKLYDLVIARDNLIERFAAYLPSLLEIKGEHIIEYSLPNLPSTFVNCLDRTTLIERALEDEKFLAVYGISGIGKTYAVNAYAITRMSEYDAIIWLSADEFRLLNDLRAVEVARLGVKLNLYSRLRTTRCLLVVDNWQGDAYDLLQYVPPDAHPGAKVIVTAIQKPKAGCHSIELPELTEPEAFQILTQGVPKIPTEDEAKQILNYVGHHPLTLAVIRGTILSTDATWLEIIQDLENIPAYPADDRVSILERILLKRAQGIEKELQILKWFSKKIYDFTFLRELLGPGGLNNLLVRSIVGADQRGVVRIHDIVFQCIQHFTTTTLPGGSVDQKFWNYFTKHWEGGNFHVRRSIQFHSDRIRSFVEARAPIASLETYIYLLIDNAEIGTPFLEAVSECSLDRVIDNRAAVRSIMEASEALYHRGKNREQRLAVLEGILQRIDKVIGAIENDGIKFDVLHHKGKFLLWSGRVDEAETTLQAALALNPSAHQTRLQLARIRAKVDNEQSAEYVTEILEAFRDDQSCTAITVVLAAFGELAHKSNQRLQAIYLSEDISLFRTAIGLAVSEGFSLPYETLGRIGRYIYYELPEVLLELANSVDFPSCERASTHEVFHIAECVKVVGKAHSEARNDQAALRRWCEQALLYYERVPRPKDFNLTMHAECLVLLNQYAPALDILDRCINKNSCHWWHRRAQALLGIGENADASEAIETAIRTADDPKYVSAFLEVKAQIEAAQDSRQCLSTLSLAIESASGEKYKSVLERKLQEFSARFQ